MIDIIIPVYNDYEGLKKTLSSIALQKIRKLINVYVIDDNSKDSYEELIDIFKEDINIILYKNNKKIGKGLSLNKGLEISSSKYIMFIEPNDLFYNPFSVNELYMKIDNDNLDIVYGKYIEVSNGLKNEITFNDNNCYSKIYRREYILKNKIEFIKSKFYSEYVFNHEAIFKTENIDSFDSFIMTHFENSDFNEYKNVDDFIKSSNSLITFMIDNNYDPKNIGTILVKTMVYLYLIYSYNIKDKNALKIIDLSKNIYDEFKRYDNTYTYNQIYEFILSSDSSDNLQILFGDFIKLYAEK